MIGGEGVAKIELYNAAGVVKIDGLTFTRGNERQIRIGYPDYFDCPDKFMDNKSWKRFWDGVSFGCEIDINFDDWDLTVSDTLGRSVQTFLKDMHNHAGVGRIKLTPHIDKAAQAYWVLRTNSWWYDYPYDRWRGIAGTVSFKGSDKLAGIDAVE